MTQEEILGHSEKRIMSSIFTLLVATLARRGGVRAMGQPSLPYSMVALRARFANDDETLWPGETVDVTLTLATLASGIEAGERLIVSGQKDIAPGKQIKIQADNGHFLARTP